MDKPGNDHRGLETAVAAEPTCKPRRAVTGLPWAVLVLAILSTSFLYALDNTILANIRPPIIHDLGHAEKLSWISVAYALGEVGSNPTWGKLYSNFDNKLLYCASVLIFDVGSAMCGAAPNVDALIAGRVIAGIGGCGIYIGTINIFSALSQVKERALYLNFVGIAWCVGTILGPIIGGAFADSSATWRWSFYVNLLISGVGAPVYLWLLPRNPSSVPQSGTRLQQIDFTGVILFTGAAVTLIMVISFGGQAYAWNSAQIIALLVATTVLWIAFGVQQGSTMFTNRSNRLFPVYFFKEKEMCLLFAENAIGIACIVVPLYSVPLYFQFVSGDTALGAGVKMLPFIFSVVVGCLVGGALFQKLSFYLPWYTVGSSLTLLGSGLLTMIRPDVPDSYIYGICVIIGLGGGIFAQISYAVGQAIQAPNRHADVTAFLSLGQMSGVSLSIGIGTSIFVNQAQVGIARIIPTASADDIQETITGVSSKFLYTLRGSQRSQVIAVIVTAIRDNFIMIAVASGMGILLSLCMRRQRLFGKPT